MTRYYINGAEVDVPADFKSFDSMLKGVENQYLEPDTVIRQILVDGRPFSPESLRDDDEYLDLAHDWEKIEFITGTLSDIAAESIDGAHEYLVKIESAAPALAAKFQDFPESEDFTNLGSLCEGLYFLGILLDKIAIGYQFKLDEIMVHGASVHEHMLKFADIVAQMCNAQEKEEFFLVADIIEHEILPFVPIWKEIFEAVRQKTALTN